MCLSWMIYLNRGSYGLLPCSEPGSENGLKRKKRRKEFAAEGASVEGSANNNDVLKEDTTKQKEDKSGDDHPTSEQDQKFSDIKCVFSLLKHVEDVWSPSARVFILV